MRPHGRTAVVTGAANGIGRAIAVSLARRGCNLALADIDDWQVLSSKTSFSVKALLRLEDHIDEIANTTQ